MNRELRHRVQAIALGVRKWAEDQDANSTWLTHDLGGWCAIASAELHRRLALVNIPAEIHISSTGLMSHVYVVVEDHVVDVTATQFGQNFRDKKVFISHLKEAEVLAYWQSEDIIADSKELRLHQERTGWPKSQIALPA